MATLLSGEQYGLSSIDNSRQNKSFVFVKLTDSAYRAIEEYIKNKGKISQHATIQFLDNEGQLSFPSNQPGHGHTFNFSLSNIAELEGPQGSFECVRQSGARTLDALGTLQSKMRIHAKEDVYEAARKNWAAAEQQHKKNCTKEIKANGPDIGRKVKVKKMMGGGFPPLSRREASPPGGHRASGITKMSTGLPNLHLVSSTNSSISRPIPKPTAGNPDILKCPIRERLMHLLALRPFKKPELMSRIRRDGLRERDKNSLSAVLKQVAYLRDNTFHLNHSLWNDIQEDWPFYSEQDRQVLKRRKPQNLTPPGSDGGSSSGSGQSPTSTHPGSPPSIISSSDLSAKRPGYFDGADGLPTKRPRISHYRRPPEPSAPVTSSGMGRAPSPLLLHPQRPPTTEDEKRRRPIIVEHQERTLQEPISRSSSNNNNSISSRNMSNNINNNNSSSCPRVTSTSCSPDSQLEGLEESKAPPIVHTNSYAEYPDYLTEYTTIRSAEQRSKYKSDFNASYGEYRDLHTIVERVFRRFVDLQARLRREEDGSDNWKALKSQIEREYNENTRDRGYQESKRRFHYLHEKLSHVKRLVLEYDSSTPAKAAHKSPPLPHKAAY